MLYIKMLELDRPWPIIIMNIRLRPGHRNTGPKPALTCKPVAIRLAGLAMFLGSVLPSFSQDYTLSGRVRELERNTGAAQSEVRVDIDNSKFIAFTNADGTFSIPGVPAGTHTIRVSKPGFVGFYKANYTLDENKTLNISLLDTMQESPSGQLPLVLDEFRTKPPWEPAYTGLNAVDVGYENSNTWYGLTEDNLIKIYLANANAADSLAFRNAIGACNGNWQDSPDGSVEKKQKRAFYLLSNDPETGLVVGKRGINVNFHQLSSNTIILGGETVNNYTYIAYVKINLATNLGRIIKKEVKGRAESKQDIFGSIRQSYMNTNPVDMTDLDHMLNIVFHNHWAAIARNEQNVNILDLENTPAFGTPAASNITAPANNASDLEKSVRIQYDNIFGADKYRLQISTMENFSTILKDLDVFRNDTTLALDAHTTYYARVQAINSTGTAPWSSTVKFTTALETSVGDIPESGFRIYPVPAGDRLNIEYISGFSGTRRTYSITGQLLDTKDIIEDTEVIDMTGTAPGIYILEFSDGRTKHYARIVRH